MGRFEDKVVIVTGSGSGIGKACAIGFAREGARVAVVDLNEDRTVETVETIRAAGGKAQAFIADVSKPDQVQSTIQKIVAEFGQINILVNSVAVAVRKKLLDLTVEDWNRTIDLFAYFLCIKFSVPEMIKAGSGKIVSIASIAGHIGYGGVTATCAVKGGILSLTRELAGELARYHININTVSPGVIQTNLNAATLADPDIRNQTIALTPWGRIGVPEDIAPVVMFLASPEADYVTGADLIVDGAMSCTLAWGAAGEKLNSFHTKK